jgi:hypothetical protein
MSTDRLPPAPSDPRRGPGRPGGSLVAAIEAGGPLADLVAGAEARDEARRDEWARAARDVARSRPPDSQ